ncbi:unnamed protein product, partial [Nesidiocoris tenuis]
MKSNYLETLKKSSRRRIFGNVRKTPFDHITMIMKGFNHRRRQTTRPPHHCVTKSRFGTCNS